MILPRLLLLVMDKETAASAQAELNVYVSSPSGRAKETTFREWVVNNQIGTKFHQQQHQHQPEAVHPGGLRQVVTVFTASHSSRELQPRYFLLKLCNR